ncbi:hypothetical protein TM4_2 [Mycobacterium phage TM4]|uniref:Uncharacterized protein n=1 Tax=Mycobacterium phage TM4 TaxID=88870 RepID=Q9ZX75_BPMT4|nr:hypothetical protein TM4_gp2 [Mycobacterium phage TM4]AAD17570.1 hypothetical protein TM4_2 [Mycobacterium phage TM4]AGK85760.1 hypothetical protein 33D_0078 [Mycobacterium phage 33D]
MRAPDMLSVQCPGCAAPVECTITTEPVEPEPGDTHAKIRVRAVDLRERFRAHLVECTRTPEAVLAVAYGG